MEFIRRHFRMFRWYPYGKTNGRRARVQEKQGKIRITKYGVFTVSGSKTRSNPYNCALYALPNDEEGMSLQEAEKQKHRLNRFKYTKQQVLAGVYDNGGARPLVWLKRDGLEKALMQGSICVHYPDGAKAYFNVDRNNGIPYDTSIKNPRRQQRYWYFGETSRVRGYGLDIDSQVPIFTNAAVAGDVYNLGLGKLLGICYEHPSSRNRPGQPKTVLQPLILADTGGAFTPNLFQLDYYTGEFRSREEFLNKLNSIPEYAVVYVFIKK